MTKKITEDGEIIDEITYETVGRTPPFFKTPWNHDTDREATNVSLECKDPSRTQQQFAKDADINNILSQFMKTGDPNLLGIGNPIYRDIIEEFDLQSVIVTGWEAQNAWNQLSPEVRNTLKDPKTFADYVDHCLERGDLEPLRALGLAPKLEESLKTQPKAPETVIVPKVSPAPEEKKAAPAA